MGGVHYNNDNNYDNPIKVSVASGSMQDWEGKNQRRTKVGGASICVLLFYIFIFIFLNFREKKIFYLVE